MLSFSPVVGIGLPYPLTRRRVCYPLLWFGVGGRCTHSLAGDGGPIPRGGGGGGGGPPGGIVFKKLGCKKKGKLKPGGEILPGLRET